MAGVDEVAGGEACRGEAVVALLCCFVGTCNDGAFEVGVAFDSDVKAAVSCHYSSIVIGADVGAFGFALAEVAVDATLAYGESC